MSLLPNHGSPSIIRKYDLIIFDLDGTLLDTSAGILSAIQYTVESLHLHPIPEDRLKSFIGPPIQWSFMKEYDVSAEKSNEYASVFRDRYKDYELLKAVPYPGIFETMKELAAKGCIMAVATYKREDYALRLLDEYGFLNICAIAHGADFAGQKKKSDIIQMCIEESGISNKDRIVLVGDTESDRIGANEAGIHFIGVTYGFGFTDEMDVKDADGMIKTPKELTEAICC